MVSVFVCWEDKEMAMNYEQVQEYMLGEDRPKSKLRLDGIRIVLEALGNPDKGKRKIHIAGTNGKGSVTAYSAYILASAGYRVAQYSSPAVYNYGERMRVLDGRNGNKSWVNNPRDGEISEEQIVKYINIIKDTIDSLDFPEEKQPSYFELNLLMAFMYFNDSDCDIWVIEVGLGGTTDSTNVIDAPEVAVITTIGLDHVDVLGNTYLEVAHSKAGILKNGTRKFCLYDQRQAIPNPEEADEVTNFLVSRAAEHGILYEILSKDNVEVVKRDLNGQVFKVAEIDAEFFTKLLPDFEPLNASLAIMATRSLIHDLRIDFIQEGIAACYWPARIEKLNQEPLILLDGAHNPQGARALRSSLNKLLPEATSEVHVMVSMKDKDYKDSLKEVLAGGKVKHLFCSTIHHGYRALDSASLFEDAQEIANAVLDEDSRPIIYNVNSVDEAVNAAMGLVRMNTQSALIGWGSFYMANEFRDASLKFLR